MKWVEPERPTGLAHGLVPHGAGTGPQSACLSAQVCFPAQPGLLSNEAALLFPSPGHEEADLPACALLEV